MPQSKAHIKATNKWLKNERERITIVVKNGRKAEIKAAAKSQDKSLNAFINDAIDTAMEPLRNVWDKPDMVLNYKGKNMEFKVIDTKK